VCRPRAGQAFRQRQGPLVHTADQDNTAVELATGKLSQQFDPVHTGHVQVQYDDFDKGFVALEYVNGRYGTVRTMDIEETELGERKGRTFENKLIVIDNEDG
jgi:hypothetical protein